jgi:hypothetical protein
MTYTVCNSLVYYFRSAVFFLSLLFKRLKVGKKKRDVGRDVEGVSATPFLLAWHVADWRTV